MLTSAAPLENSGLIIQVKGLWVTSRSCAKVVPLVPQVAVQMTRTRMSGAHTPISLTKPLNDVLQDFLFFAGIS